tara:strand:+ start:421 stop:1134 length:714 start_codon:yes stop_codon:yes gene_type:complete
MIVIPMLGKSSRFTNAGYSLPKYMLPVKDKSVFSWSMSSFENYFTTEEFLFLVRKDHECTDFLKKELSILGINRYEIIEFDKETSGQGESVYLGIKNYPAENNVLIFNIDTVRKGFNFKNFQSEQYGYLEVFKSAGTNWSFVEPGIGNNVIRTTEKDRISDLCSNGIYFFSDADMYCHYFEKYSSMLKNKESYIAPMYNLLIKDGIDVFFEDVSDSKIIHLGTPDDYQAFLSSEDAS